MLKHPRDKALNAETFGRLRVGFKVKYIANFLLRKVNIIDESFETFLCALDLFCNGKITDKPEDLAISTPEVR